MTEHINSQDPSLHVGDTTREDELHEVMRRAVTLFELPDDEFDKALPAFVVERMDELSEGASTDFMTNDTKGTKDFIVPERPQEIMGFKTKPFLMDDPELYIKSIAWIRQQFHQLQSSHPDFAEDKIYTNAALRGALAGQWEYFGSYAGNKNDLIRATADIIDEDGSVYASIADIGKAAICQQRASAVHNTLSILGLDSKYETGDLTIDNEIKETERHAYVVVSRDGKKILFDPTHPVLNKSEGQGVTWLSPQMTEIPAGVTDLETQLPEITTRADGTQQKQITHTLRYTFN